jgi:hypothetical protein
LETGFDRLIQDISIILSGKFKPIGQILSDAHGKHNRTSEHHPHLATQGDQIQLGIENILAIQPDLA